MDYFAAKRFSLARCDVFVIAAHRPVRTKCCWLYYVLA